MSHHQLSYELYKWLSGLNIIPSNMRYKSSGSFQLDNRHSDELLSGYAISKLLFYLAKELSIAINDPLVGSVKNSNTPATRIYNWNILTEGFLKLNVNLTKTSQKQITSGDFSALVRFLIEIFKKFGPTKIQKTVEEQEDLSLKKLQFIKNHSQAETVLELIILIISEHLQLTPKQAMSTLSEGAKYFAHMVVKGIKNSFNEITSMFESITKEIPRILYLAEKSPEKNMSFMLDLIKPTLISRDSGIARIGASTFKMFIDESLKYNSKNLVYQILVKESEGFDFLYMGIKRHPDLVQEFSQFLHPLIETSYNEFFEIYLKRTINNEQEYLNIIIKLVEGLVKNPTSKKQIKESGLLEMWVRSCEQSFYSRKNRQQALINQETKLLYLELMCNLWKYYSSEMSDLEAEELLLKGIDELKRNTRKDIYTIKIPALLRIFDFLQFLASGKNKLAAVVYKKMIFLLVQNHQQLQIRQLILDNFSLILRKFPTIPIEHLIEPVLRQLVNSQGTTYILNVFDFQFLIQACRHPRMEASHALEALEFLSKLVIKNVIYSHLILRTIEILIDRFCEEEAIIEYIKKNIKGNLNLYGILIFNKKKVKKDQAIINKQKKSLIIQMLRHFIELQHQQLNQFLKDTLLDLYIHWVDQKYYKDKGLYHLLTFLGDMEQMIIEYKIKKAKKNDYFSQSGIDESMPFVTNQSNIISNKNRLFYEDHELSYEQEYLKEQGIGYKVRQSKARSRIQDLLSKGAIKPEPGVLDDLEKIKQKVKYEKKRKLEKSLSKQKVDKKNTNSLQLLQRNISLGYAKLTQLPNDQILFDFDSVKVKQLKISLKFYHTSELQERDDQTSIIIFKRYEKQLKTLFVKYSLQTASSKRQSQGSCISYTELVRMIKQKDFPNINKVVIGEIISSVNSQRKDKNLLSGIDESQINQFLIKLTDYMIQTEINIEDLPFGLKLEDTIQRLLRGENFYQNKFRYKQDPKITKLKEEINNKTSQNQFQQIEIPEGYRKIKQKHIDLDPVISQNVDQQFPEKLIVCYEALDEILFKTFKFHIITPLVDIRQKFNLVQIPKAIKPRIPKNETEINARNFVNGLETPTPTISKDGQNKQKKKLSEALIRIDKRKYTRSQSQKAISKKKNNKTQQDHDKEKKDAKKRQRYLASLKDNLDKLRQEKDKKNNQQEKIKVEKQNRQKKKQQIKQKHLQANKQKVKVKRQKEELQKKIQQQKDQKNKQIAKQELKKKGQKMLQKEQQRIRQKAEKLSERRKQLQISRQRKNHIIEKLAKKAIQNNSFEDEKVKMMEIKNSLQKGKLKEIVNKYEKNLKQLFQGYWVWSKERIDLNSFSNMLKNYQINPDFISPKLLSEVFKIIALGQPLDFKGWLECIAKCSYRSEKITKEIGEQEQTKSFEFIMQKLRVDQQQYKQILKLSKQKKL